MIAEVRLQDDGETPRAFAKIEVVLPNATTTRDALLAGAAASVLAGVPSTLHALATGQSIVENAAAAGSILLPNERRSAVLVAAAVPVHLALSFGWAQVIATVVPRRWPVAGAIGCGLAIAALDLSVIGQHITRIRDLPQPPQWLDHVAYGATVGLVLRTRWRSRIDRDPL
jgi:hypothetical protein